MLTGRFSSDLNWDCLAVRLAPHGSAYGPKLRRKSAGAHLNSVATSACIPFHFRRILIQTEEILGEVGQSTLLCPAALKTK